MGAMLGGVVFAAGDDDDDDDDGVVDDVDGVGEERGSNVGRCCLHRGFACLAR